MKEAVPGFRQKSIFRQRLAMLAAIAVVALLIAHGAAIDAADNRGRTALMIAAERGDAAVVENLIMHGADRARRDKAGKTVCDLAPPGTAGVPPASCQP